MARLDPQVNVRMPLALKERLDQSARAAGRSLTAEVVYRLEASFPAEIEVQILDSRREELSKLRGLHASAMRELKQYRDRRARGDSAPFGMEWLHEVILQVEYRVNRLERLIARTEREIDELTENHAEKLQADDRSTQPVASTTKLQGDLDELQDRLSAAREALLSAVAHEKKATKA